MSAVKVKDIEKALLAKGFTLENSHHKMFWLMFQGKKTSIRTRISNGAKEYDDNLLAQMSKQMGISRGQFDSFVECTLSGPDYAAHLVETKKVVPAEEPKQEAGKAAPAEPKSK